MDDAYFQRPPPKSTGLEYFNLAWLEKGLECIGGRPGAEDVQATLTELTAAAIAEAIAGNCAPRRVILCGGGTHNTALTARLAMRLTDAAVESSALHGIDPEWVEAVLFAWLARARLRGEPGNAPSVTGACRPAPLGGVYYGMGPAVTAARRVCRGYAQPQTSRLLHQPRAGPARVQPAGSSPGQGRDGSAVGTAQVPVHFLDQPGRILRDSGFRPQAACRNQFGPPSGRSAWPPARGPRQPWPRKTNELVAEQYRVLNDELIPELADAGIPVSFNESNGAPGNAFGWRITFTPRSVSVLSPTTLDPHAPDPAHPSTKSLNFIVSPPGTGRLRPPTATGDRAGPRAPLPRLIQLPVDLPGTGGADFVLLSSIIHAFVDPTLRRTDNRRLLPVPGHPATAISTSITKKRTT